MSSRGRRPRLDIQTEADSQTKEKKVSLKACKSEAKIFAIPGPFTFTPTDTFSLSMEASTSVSI